MIISGVILPVKTAPAPAASTTSRLTVGEVLTGRVTQVNGNGQGVVRFPDGSGFTFSRGPALTLGEPVQVEVLRLEPEMAFRLLASSSQSASQLAVSAEQSLVRAPDLFANLVRWAGLGNSSPAEAEASLASGGNSGSAQGFAVLGKSLAHLLQRVLPNLSVQGLLDGEVTELVRLLEGGSRQDVRAAIQQLRQGAIGLLLAEERGVGQATTGAEGSDLGAVRNTIHRLGDLLAMQEILPRTPLAAEGNQLLGYRLFWLVEGGMGEAIWYRERQWSEPDQQQEQEGESSSGGGEEKRFTTVLLTLNMTNLGAVQSRLSYGEGLCTIHIAAEEEEALAALRRRVGELRSALLEAELPIGALDLTRLVPGELKEKRMRAMGLASHFSAEA
ncbi:MAG: flagellar hook-length control protein FliK [Magnetococcales bacterium]|nr:flagellar hook-length control protein FliK [Magnetococcales bacterium]